MNVKTVKAALSNKFNHWLSSIDDDHVREVAERSAYITGGAITSLLLSENVNDYDIYFDNADDAKVVLNYYLRIWRDNTSGYGSPYILDARIQDNIENFDDSEPTLPDGYQLNDERILYIWIQSKGAVGVSNLKKKQARDYKKAVKRYRPLFISNGAITLADGVQLVSRFVGTPENVHKYFDYAHATCYYIPKERRLELPQLALQSIVTRELYYTGSMYPLSSIFRSRKFIQRGWKISVAQFLKMAFQLNSLDLTDVGTLREQLTGVDSAYLSSLIYELEEKQQDEPGFQIDELYLMQLAERIFDHEPDDTSEHSDDEDELEFEEYDD